jgi:hypothetical protein
MRIARLVHAALAISLLAGLPAASAPTPLRGDTALYPRAIRLQHSGTANGTIVASVVAFGGGTGLGAIYQSTNDGQTFAQVGTVTDPDAAQGLCCTSIFELPSQIGALPAGTLLWAASERADAGTSRRMEIRIWRSADQGRTWSLLATPAVASNNLGMWEPELAVAADGRLAVYFSDETQQPAHSQTLVESVSSDGVSWSPKTNIVASSDASARPGMPVVRRLPSGTYFMTYEVCGGSYGCAARSRYSADGLNWGSVTDLGGRIETVDGKYFAHTPTVAWYDNGTQYGRLVLVGQILMNADGSVAADNGNTVLVNTESGSTYWYELPAPVPVPGARDNYCPNYSSTVLPSADAARLLEIATDYTSDGNTCQASYASASLTGTDDATGIVSGTTYRLVNVMSGNCLDVSADSRVDGGNIQQWTCNNLGPQNFRLTAAAGSFTLTGQSSGKCVDVTDASTEPGANVQQWTCNGSGAQAWNLVNVGRDYYTLVNANSGLCLDVSGGSKDPGANVQQWTCNKLSPQIWRLER